MDINKSYTQKGVKDRFVLLACFGIPALLMVLLYCCLMVWPAGKNAVLVLDLNAQYIYYFEQFRDILTSGESLIYSFERALGGEFMGIFAYYLSSPFSLIVALFPKDSITEAMYLILVLKTGFCGLSFGYYLLKTRPTLDNIYSLMFSVMYALCSYVVVMQNNVMWIDNVIIFPIILLSIDELIKHGKFKLYVLSLVYSIMSNFYIGYMMCLFIVVWFFARYFMLRPSERNPQGEDNHFLKSFLRIALWSLLAVMISAIIILPIYYSLTFGKLEFSDPKYTPKQMFEFADLVTKAFFGSYDSVRPAGMPFIYCGTLALILAPIYFFCDSVPTRRKIGYASVLLFLIVGFNFSIADIIWHGLQRPNWLNARFAFMFVGLMLTIAVDAFMNLKEIGSKAVKVSSILWCVLLLILSKIEYDHIHDFKTVWASILIFFIISAILPSCIKHMRDPDVCRKSSALLCCVIIAEAIGNGVIMLYALDEDVGVAKRNSYRQMVDTYSAAVATYKDESDDSFYRSEKLKHRKKNDNFALDINGMSNSTSTLNAKAIDLLSQFGYASMSHWSLYSGSTAVTDSLFNIKYIMADSTEDIPSYITVLYDLHASTEDKIDIYENPYPLSLAYSVNADILEYDLPSENEDEDDLNYLEPFRYMNLLLESMVGHEVDVWRRVDVESSTQSGCKTLNVKGHRGYEDNGSGTPKLTYELNIESPETVYAYFPSEYPRDAHIKVNGSDIGDYFDNETFAIVEIGSFEIGEEVEVGLYMDEEKMYIRTGCSFFWYFDESEYFSVMEELSDGLLDAHSDKDTHVFGDITVPEGDSVVFTTIPYDKGWEVKVDGDVVETVAVLNETLLAFRIDEGEHYVEFTYKPNCVKYGLILSGCGIVIFVSACLIDFIIKRKRSLKNVCEENFTTAYTDEIISDDELVPPTLPEEEADEAHAEITDNEVEQND
ncbi:MAG: hypothetical protein E7672_04585 [Ruminococcaceae bacterium]|nr:hypothetical protein [Oscillospiraceae bacterium]